MSNDGGGGYQHNPWESGLAHAPQNRAIIAEEVAKEEAKKLADEEAKKCKELERAAAEEAARPKPTGPPKHEFLSLVHGASDAGAKLGLVKGRAADMFKQGFPEEAAEMYTMAIQLQPSHALHGNRSACRCAYGNYEGALEDANAAVRLNASWAKGYARKGAALHGLCRFEEAVRAYEDGLAVDADNAALQAGLVDALKRHKAAGGTWEVSVDGSRIISHSPVGKMGAQLERLSFGRTRQIEKSRDDDAPSMMGPQLGFLVRDKEETGVPPLASLCAAPFYCGPQLLVADGARPKVFNLRNGLMAREFNTRHKKSGAKTFDEAPSGLALDPKGFDEALYACERRSGKLYRLLIDDSRSQGSKEEKPDKILAEVKGRDLGLSGPRGLCLADTSRVSGDELGERTLYLCDTGNGRLVAFEPKALTPAFTVGSKGCGEGELDAPVSICACGEHLAVADAGNSRISIFTLRGTFVRNVGERASESYSRMHIPACTFPHSHSRMHGVHVHRPVHIALAPGHLFVLEDQGSAIHVLHPDSGEPLGLLLPPFNLLTPRDAKGNLDHKKAEGCLSGLCVDDDALYVGSTMGPPRVLRLLRNIMAPPPRSRPPPKPPVPSGEGAEVPAVEIQ